MYSHLLPGGRGWDRGVVQCIAELTNTDVFMCRVIKNNWKKCACLLPQQSQSQGSQ